MGSRPLCVYHHRPMADRSAQVEQSYALAVEQYAALGVDAKRAIEGLARIPISLHCWQGDDIGGFENTGSALGGGLAVTGNYPGKARTADELRADLERALSLIPGQHRVNLHASYAETGGKAVERDQLTAEDFHTWIPWAKSHGLAWTSIRPPSPTPSPPTASPCRTPTTASADSGSATALPA